MLKRVLLLLAIFFPLFVSADNVPYSRAKEIADIFFNQGVPTRAYTPVTLVSDDGLYIFKGSSGGFVIVSSDDVVEPVLGYSTTGDFDIDNLPDNFKWWIEEVKRGIKHLKDNKVPQSQRVRSLWLSAAIPTKAGAKGGKLLETANWGQQSPFNKMSPTVNGKSTAAGCVPVAMAILMRYFSWPQKGKGKLESYSFSGGSITGHELGHEYRWDKMPMRLNESSDPEQINEVARLIYDCGVMTQADFGVYGTTASDYTAFTKMIEHMDYDASAEYVYGAGYTRDSWVEKICSNIDNVGPVYYTSYEGKDVIGAGHSYILDGYDENGNIHINWGSGLPSNGGYFAFPDFGNFSRWHIAVFNLQPNKNGEPVDVITLSEYNGQKGLSLSIKPSEIEPFKSFTVTASMILNTGIAPYVGHFAIGTVKANGELKEIIGQRDLTKQSLSSYKGYVSIQFNCVITMKPEEGETIRLFYKGEKMTSWKAANYTENVVGAISIYHLDIEKQSTFEYTHSTNVIVIRTPVAVSFEIKDSAGKVVTSGIKSAESNGERTITIDAAQLKPDTYSVRLFKGEISKSFSFAIGTK